MNKKTLKATAAIGLCCVLMVVVVIYTPKPTPEPTKGRETLEEGRQRREKEFTHLNRVSEALRKAIEAKTIYHEKVIRFNDEGRAYFETAPLNLLIEASTRAIEGLTEANEAIRRRTGELQLRNEEKAPLKSLLDANVKANTKLIAALTEVSAEMKAYTEVFQRLSKEKVSTLQSNETIRKVSNASIKVSYAITEALTTQEEAINAHHEYQRARSRARW